MTAEKESSYESEIQACLSDLFHKVTPYVKTEAQGRKFDMVAYLPEGIHQLEGITNKRTPRPTDIDCYFRFRRTHCRRKSDNMMTEARTIGSSKGFIYKGKDYGYDGIWSAIKGECKCDMDVCPTYKEAKKRQIRIYQQARKDLAIQQGLHTFEIKSDYDTHERLAKQIPTALRVADFAWLVTGENQTIPEWMPPYIGLLQYNEKKHRFILKRRPSRLRQSFTFYRHVLGSEKFSSENTAVMGTFMSDHIFEKLLRKWFINSIFYWDFECNIIDMTEELDHLAKTAHWFKTKREAKVEPTTIQKMLLTNEYLGELE